MYMNIFVIYIYHYVDKKYNLLFCEIARCSKLHPPFKATPVDGTQVYLQMYLGTITKYQVQVYNLTSTAQWPDVDLLLGDYRQRLLFAGCSAGRCKKHPCFND